MKTITKFLVLVPLVVLGAACNGNSPSAPDAPVSADEGLATVPGTSVAGKSAVVDSCRGVIGVSLEALPPTKVGVVIKATYVQVAGSGTGCAAPVWTSNPRGALTTTQLNAFRVGVNAVRPLTVTATAPNGVRGSLTLGADAELQASAECQNVTGVQLRVVPSPTQTAIVVEATYLRFGPSLANCPAPAWTSNPRGILAGTKDPFRVRVSGATRPAVVTATAPNGIRGELALQR